MALQVYVINPILAGNYNVQKILVPDLLGVPAIWVTLAVCLISVVGILVINKKKSK